MLILGMASLCVPRGVEELVLEEVVLVWRGRGVF